MKFHASIATTYSVQRNATHLLLKFCAIWQINALLLLPWGSKKLLHTCKMLPRIRLSIGPMKVAMKMESFPCFRRVFR